MSAPWDSTDSFRARWSWQCCLHSQEFPPIIAQRFAEKSCHLYCARHVTGTPSDFARQVTSFHHPKYPEFGVTIFCFGEYQLLCLSIFRFRRNVNEPSSLWCHKPQRSVLHRPAHPHGGRVVNSVSPGPEVGVDWRGRLFVATGTAA